MRVQVAIATSFFYSIVLVNLSSHYIQVKDFDVNSLDGMVANFMKKTGPGEPKLGGAMVQIVGSDIIAVGFFSEEKNQLMQPCLKRVMDLVVLCKDYSDADVATE